jgi:hypothetical protein
MAVAAWSAREGFTTFVDLASVEAVEEGPFFEHSFFPYLRTVGFKACVLDQPAVPKGRGL